jgi:hypothetical protein
MQDLNNKTAKALVKTMKDMVKRKVDFAGKKYSALKNPRGGRSAQSRLNDSGKFADNWVMVDGVNDKGFNIRPSNANHSGNVTHADILKYNDANSSEVNGNIDDPPELTPSKDSQVTEMSWFDTYERKMGEIITQDLADIGKMTEIVKSVSIKLGV